MIETPDLLPIRQWVEALRILNGAELYGGIVNKRHMIAALVSEKHLSLIDFERLKKILLTGVKKDGKIFSDQCFDEMDPQGRFGFFELLADIIHKNFSTLQYLQQEQSQKTQG